ncbi:hypothetical protein BGZ60DRAFT_531921 [Tricladium varicosporioides]|nr:hypothetical protein BGZ60DRAFT_531921 [Hymenoscyphus varicosporioides]
MDTPSSQISQLYHCGDCSKQNFPTQQALWNHRHRYHECPYCELVFASRQNLRYHLFSIENHKGEGRSFTCAVDGCTKRLLSDFHRAVHIRKFHKKLFAAYHCRYCYREETYQGRLELHVDEAHAEKPTLLLLGYVDQVEVYRQKHSNNRKEMLEIQHRDGQHSEQSSTSDHSEDVDTFNWFHNTFGGIRSHDQQNSRSHFRSLDSPCTNHAHPEPDSRTHQLNQKLQSPSMDTKALGSVPTTHSHPDPDQQPSEVCNDDAYAILIAREGGGFDPDITDRSDLDHSRSHRDVSSDTCSSCAAGFPDMNPGMIHLLWCALGLTADSHNEVQPEAPPYLCLLACGVRPFDDRATLEWHHWCEHDLDFP